eukprot:1986215-Amphidinium_carterae.1
MAQQTFDAVPVLSGLIARQLTALLGRHVDADRVKQQVESLGLPTNATLPDVCLAWNRRHLGVLVPGVTSETTASCRLELSFVNTYEKAVEAATWDRLLVSLDGGIPALGRSLRDQQCIMCLSWQHGHLVPQDTRLDTEEVWDTKVHNAWTAKVVLTGRGSNDLPVSDRVDIAPGPLQEGENENDGISMTMTMTENTLYPFKKRKILVPIRTIPVAPNATELEELISTQRCLAAVWETWKGNGSDAGRTRTKRLEDMVERILT